MKKIIRICLNLILFISAVIYPGMAFLTAAGWKYHVREGDYPELFSIYSFWMILGAVLVLLGVISCIFGKKAKCYFFNLTAVFCSLTGMTACLIVLQKFSAYADRNFSGIGERMQPVSDLYQGRLMPIILPVFLTCFLSVWQLADHHAYRIQKLAEQNAEAPGILDEK